MIPTLLPPGAVGVDATEAEWGDDLFPIEREQVAGAADRRSREFAAGRSCARRALAELGYDPEPILMGPHREPLWPAGVVGSITHSRSYCAAAVAPAGTILSLGIDAEPNTRLGVDVRELVCTPSEQRTHRRHERIGNADPAMLTFSAKESLYKAWFPLTGQWLDFLDAVVEFHDGGLFSVELQPSASPDAVEALPAAVRWEGRWATNAAHVFTTVVAWSADGNEP